MHGTVPVIVPLRSVAHDQGHQLDDEEGFLPLCIPGVLRFTASKGQTLTNHPVLTYRDKHSQIIQSSPTEDKHSHIIQSSPAKILVILIRLVAWCDLCNTYYRAGTYQVVLKDNQILTTVVPIQLCLLW